MEGLQYLPLSISRSWQLILNEQNSFWCFSEISSMQGVLTLFKKYPCLPQQIMAHPLIVKVIDKFIINIVRYIQSYIKPGLEMPKNTEWPPPSQKKNVFNFMHIFFRYLGSSYENGPPTKISIFMQYVPGGTLNSILARFGPLEDPVIARYTRQILEALEYLHRNHVVHR